MLLWCRPEVAACGGTSGMNLGESFEAQPLDKQVQIIQTMWEMPLARLLVFDNCEDEALLDEWRPKHGGSRVLVTSRRQQWSPALGVEALHIEVLPRPESIALLRKFRADLPEDDPDLNAIVEELGDLPLALHMAGSFLLKYQHAITPAQYRERLRKPTLLDDRSLRAADISPTKHVQHVARTFEQSYERLDPTDPNDALAVKLLVRAAHFAPGEPLPRWLLVQTLNLPKDDPDAALQAEDSIIRLIDLGLLETEDEDSLRLHRLLGCFAQSIVKDANAQIMVEEAISRVANYYNREGDPRPLLVLQPHLRFITDWASQHEDELAAGLCNTLGYHLNISGDYRGALKYFERALAIREQVLGPEHPDTATSLNNLATVLQHVGDLEGARQYHERALAIREQVLGPGHPDNPASLNNLGSLLYAQGDLVGAQEYYERALAIAERVLGVEHRNTVRVLNNLGAVLQDLGDLAGAREYYERALAIQERLLGTEHPDTASSLNNLGELLRALGDLEGARQYHERALAIVERVLGEEHPGAATSLNNLGLVLQGQGDFVGARSYYERALTIREQVLGVGHPNTATSIWCIGSLFAASGERDGARAQIQRALDIYTQTLGASHPTTQQCQHALNALDAPPHTREQQIAEIEQQMQAAVEQSLVQGNAEVRAALATAIEQRAQWAENDEKEGSPYLALAARLRALAARLRGEE